MPFFDNIPDMLIAVSSFVQDTEAGKIFWTLPDSFLHVEKSGSRILYSYTLGQTDSDVMVGVAKKEGKDFQPKVAGECVLIFTQALKSRELLRLELQAATHPPLDPSNGVIVVRGLENVEKARDIRANWVLNMELTQLYHLACINAHNELITSHEALRQNAQNLLITHAPGFLIGGV